MTMQDLTGQMVGQYQLRELIGVGGMGAVYRGYQITLERAVAVKVLSTALAAESGYVERFYREAKTSAALEHAHIVPVHDFGIQGNLSYVVMRLLTGGTLQERMHRLSQQENRLPSLGEVSLLLSQMASALDYAHSRGVIHRDIKPSNIMFDNQGISYLVDFGIAKLVEATSQLTGTGTTMGTPTFMPPEQWRSEELNASADQYALGATIYALMIGRAPYEATTPFGLMHKHLNEMPTPPHHERADVPEAITVVMERVLAKAPEDRFPTVTAFAQAFDSAIRGQAGEVTDFFVTKLPPKEPVTLPTIVETPPAAPPGGAESAATPAASATPPSMVMTTPHPRSAGSRSLIWLLGGALIVALVVIALLVLRGGDNESGGDTPADTGVPAVAVGETVTPTEEPTLEPTIMPTVEPTTAPTLTPTLEPTASPTEEPTLTATPTLEPTTEPTVAPTATPTLEPTAVVMVGEPVLVVGPGGTFVRPVPSFHAEFEFVSNVELPITGITPHGDWYRVGWRDAEGWVFKSSLVEAAGDLSQLAVVEYVEPAASDRPVLVVGAMGASLRREPSFEAERQPVANVELPVNAVSANGRWFLVEYEGQEWWVRQSVLIEVRGDLGLAEVVEIGEPAVPENPVLVVGALGAYVRPLPSFGAAQVAIANVELPITGITPDGQWYRVVFEDRDGWVRQSALVEVMGDLGLAEVVDYPAPEPAGDASDASAEGPVYLGRLFSDRFDPASLDNNWLVLSGQAEVVPANGNDENMILTLAAPGDDWAIIQPRDPVTGDYSVMMWLRVVRPQRAEIADVYLFVRTRRDSGAAILFSTINQIGIGYKSGEEWTDFERRDAPFEVNQWYHVRVDVSGSHIVVFVNGQVMMETFIDDLPDGTFRLAIPPDVVIEVDDVFVRLLTQSDETLRDAHRVQLVADADLFLHSGGGEPVIGAFPHGEELYLIEISEDHEWAYVRHDPSGLQGWIPVTSFKSVR